MVKRQRTAFGRLWVCFYLALKSILHELTTTIDAMQQMSSDINKIRRSLWVILLLSNAAQTSCRRPDANRLQKLALPSRPVEKLQHWMQDTSRWNRHMVFSRERLRWVEWKGLFFVDPRKTCVLNVSFAQTLILSSSFSGRWKEHFAVRLALLPPW